MGYVTAAEYNTLTGRPASEANEIRIMISSKLLDSRIGNYPIYEDGYKIKVVDSTFYVFLCSQDEEIHISKKNAVQMWVSEMISYLTDNNNKPPSQADNLKLGRFSVGKSGAANTGQLLPDSMSYVDTILISSGIINRKVTIK